MIRKTITTLCLSFIVILSCNIPSHAISWRCLPWIAHPLWLQAIGAIKILQMNGNIQSKDQCHDVAKQGKDIAGRFEVPGFISGSLGKCSCDSVF